MLVAGPDPFGDFPLEERIRGRATSCGVPLTESGARLLAEHARAVLRANKELHLTSITDPEEFLERHIGEAFEAAALMNPGIRGSLLDLGSGNGYPGLPLAAARPGLEVLLTEASPGKSAFLREVLRETQFPAATVIEAQVQRPADLDDVDPIRVLSCRAMGGWEKILPRLASCFTNEGQLLLWAGEEVETILKRTAWRKYRLEERRPLPGRDRSWIWCLRSIAQR